VQVKVIRDPGDLDPAQPHGKEEYQRLAHASKRQVVEQVTRELGDRKDVNEVEEQLDRQHVRRLPGGGAEYACGCFVQLHALILLGTDRTQFSHRGHRGA